MRIALDYDECYTEDVFLWKFFIAQAKVKGHSVTFVTYRDSRWNNDDIKLDAEIHGIDIVYTNGKQKAGCFEADIWIDDNPVTIPVAKDLGDMYDGCLINSDY